MNATYYRYEILRLTRDKVGLFFTAGLPALMYLIFGAMQSYATQSAGNGNVGTYVMISMALYGAITATSAIGSDAATERMLGWGRQLGLTPLTDAKYVGVKIAKALTVALFPVAVIYLIGALTGAKADPHVWWQSALLVLVGAGMFSLFGLCFGLGMQSRSASSAASGALVVLSFLGGLFMPLSGVLLTIARFTPLYGIGQLARYPLTEGTIVTMDATSVDEPLWKPVANLVAWILILALLALRLVRRGRGRQ